MVTESLFALTNQIIKQFQRNLYDFFYLDFKGREITGETFNWRCVIPTFKDIVFSLGVPHPGVFVRRWAVHAAAEGENADGGHGHILPLAGSSLLRSGFKIPLS